MQVNQDKEVKGALLTEQGDHLVAVAARSRGLVVAGTRGVIYVFDPIDQQAKKLGNHDPFKLVRRLVVKMPGAALPSLVPMPSAPDAMMPRNAVLDLSVSGGEDSFALVTAGGEVLTVSMTAAQDFDDKAAMEAVGHEDEHVGGPASAHEKQCDGASAACKALYHSLPPSPGAPTLFPIRRTCLPSPCYLGALGLPASSPWMPSPSNH